MAHFVLSSNNAMPRYVTLTLSLLIVTIGAWAQPRPTTSATGEMAERRDQTLPEKGMRAAPSPRAAQPNLPITASVSQSVPSASKEVSLPNTPPKDVAKPAGAKSSGLITKVKEKIVGRKAAAATPVETSEQNESAATAEESEAPTPSSSGVAMVPAASEPTGPRVRSGEFSPLEQTVAKYKPTQLSATPVAPSEVCHNIRAFYGRIRDNYAAGDHEAVTREAEAIRSQVCGLRSLSTLPLEKRLKVSSICRMIDDALQLVEEGQQTGDESKVELGLEKLHQANELLEPLDEQE